MNLDRRRGNMIDLDGMISIPYLEKNHVYGK